MCMNCSSQELGATGDVKGIVKILREYEETSSGSPISRLTVIYLVELDTAHQSLASSGCKKWITDEEVAQLSKLSVEPLTWDILNAVAEKRKRNESVYPSEVLECVKACTGVDRRRVSENSRPQILRVESLVDQLLSASEYGCDGELLFTIYTFNLTSRPLPNCFVGQGSGISVEQFVLAPPRFCGGVG